MPLRLPRPGDQAKLQAVEVQVSSLVRLSVNPATEPWWSRDAGGRFDDPRGEFGVCYMADSLEAAFCETVLRDSSACLDGNYLVPVAVALRRHVVRFEPRPGHTRLRLADLTGPALKALGLNNDISAGDDYEVPQAWARFIHDADASWDGIRYVSRQYNTRFCYALFERDNVSVASSERLSRQMLDGLARRLGVPFYNDSRAGKKDEATARRR